MYIKSITNNSGRISLSSGNKISSDLSLRPSEVKNEVNNLLSSNEVSEPLKEIKNENMLTGDSYSPPNFAYLKGL